MNRPKRWNILPSHDLAADLAARLKTSPLIAQLLLTRGYSDPADCRRFIRPSLGDLHKPILLPGLAKAAERVAKAIRDGDKIVIYGDYDVDGITATAILWHAIKVLGGTVDFYIPHRIDEGYGLNAEAITQICDAGAKLILTVDCGVTAIEQAMVAAGRGVDLIITDHHEWHEREGDESGEVGGGDVGGGEVGGRRDAGATVLVTDALPTAPPPYLPTALLGPTAPLSSPHLPDCFALVHPRLPTADAPYPNPVLCGAGVAFKLAWGIGMAVCGSEKVSDAFRAFLLDATALAALGTIADVVPLVGENRALAHFGLGGLKESKLVGLRALIASAGLTGQNLSSFDVGFKLAPRLNACGRMGHARLAVEMLTSADEAKAGEIAQYLEQQNRLRQVMERKIVAQAVEQVTERGFDKDDQCAIVLGHAEWHPGVIGIVASRIVERYHRPAVMVALNNGHGQGSGRSIAGFHLARALHACRQHLDAHGGHEMAAGLKVRTENFEAFRDAFCAARRRSPPPRAPGRGDEARFAGRIAAHHRGVRPRPAPPGPLRPRQPPPGLLLPRPDGGHAPPPRRQVRRPPPVRRPPGRHHPQVHRLRLRPHGRPVQSRHGDRPGRRTDDQRVQRPGECRAGSEGRAVRGCATRSFAIKKTNRYQFHAQMLCRVWLMHALNRVY